MSADLIVAANHERKNAVFVSNSLLCSFGDIVHFALSYNVDLVFCSYFDSGYKHLFEMIEFLVVAIGIKHNQFSLAVGQRNAINAWEDDVFELQVFL